MIYRMATSWEDIIPSNFQDSSSSSLFGLTVSYHFSYSEKAPLAVMKEGM